MTDLIPGKRYRVNYNISVLSPRALESLCPAGSEVDHLIVEPLPDPLPTTPGSVVWVKSSSTPSGERAWFLGPEDWTNGRGDYMSSDMMQRYTILRTFDAGAERA